MKSLRQTRRTCLKANVATAASLWGKRHATKSEKDMGTRHTGPHGSWYKDCTVYSQSEKKPLESFKPGSGMISFAFFSRFIWLLDEELVMPTLSYIFKYSDTYQQININTEERY